MSKKPPFTDKPWKVVPGYMFGDYEMDPEASDMATEEERDANARLMQAAPDIYHELDRLVGVLADMECQHLSGSGRNQMLHESRRLLVEINPDWEYK